MWLPDLFSVDEVDAIINSMTSRVKEEVAEITSSVVASVRICTSACAPVQWAMDLETGH